MASSDNEPTFRQATEADAPAIASIIRRIVLEGNPVGFSEPMTTAQVRDWLQQVGERGGIFLAAVGEEMAGFSTLEPQEATETASLGVWVLKEFRRKKLGVELAQCALEHARDHGFKRIRGRLPEGNEAALSFLSEIGAMVPIVNPGMRFELPL